MSPSAAPGQTWLQPGTPWMKSEDMSLSAGHCLPVAVLAHLSCPLLSQHWHHIKAPVHALQLGAEGGTEGSLAPGSAGGPGCHP